MVKASGGSTVGRPVTAIHISVQTREELDGLRRGRDTYDSIIQRLLRFHRRFREAGEAELKEELLP